MDATIRPCGFRITPRRVPAASGVDEALHVLEEPVVGAGGPVEPGGVVQADHAGGVALEVEGPPTDAGPVGCVAEQRRVQVRVVVERSR